MELDLFVNESTLYGTEKHIQIQPYLAGKMRCKKTI